MLGLALSALPPAQGQVQPRIKQFLKPGVAEMTVVKITVPETSLKKDLADEYAVPNLEPCPVLKAGQVFYATNTCPKGMCDAGRSGFSAM